MEEQVVALFAGNEGFLDEVPVAQVPRFQDELREHLRSEGTILEAIRETGDVSDETDKKLREAIESFSNTFNVEQDEALVS
jgi:F-type H+-transporting ATPase subunit alpha